MSAGAPTPARRVFVAGATGATGQAFLRAAAALGADVVPHVRPRSAAKAPPGAAILELGDADALAAALRAVTTVVQLIGTMRRRFASGDTYATSDVDTTSQLVLAARRAGTVDHVVLLSSVGAGRPVGAYLRAKAEAEAIVRQSGLAWTIFRPSFLDGDGRRAPPGARAVTRLLHLCRYEPITTDELAAAMLRVALRRAPLGAALEGDSLWAVVRAS